MHIGRNARVHDCAAHSRISQHQREARRRWASLAVESARSCLPFTVWGCSRPYPYFWPLPLLFCPYPYFFPILFTGPILKLFCSAVASSRVLPPFVDDAEREESLGK